LQKDFAKSDHWLDTILENNNLAQSAKNKNTPNENGQNSENLEEQEQTKRNLVSSKQIGDILLRKSFNSFMNQRYYEAEEFIFRAIKNDPKLTDFSVLLRLGYIYLKRESIEDAYTVLSKACSVNSKSALVWMGLAIAALSLDRLEEAEASLRMANILDPINSEIWGYSILLGLKDERKTDQSLQMLDKYLALPIENLEVLNSIGEVLMNLDYDMPAYSVFYRLLMLHGNSQKLTSQFEFDLETIKPELVKANPVKIENSRHNPVSPHLSNKLSNKLNIVRNENSQNEPEIEENEVSLTPEQIKAEKMSKLLIKPIFLQGNTPHSPNISLPKIYWIIGQLLHKFHRFPEAIEFYDLAILEIEGEGMKQFIIEMRQEAQAMKETGTKLVVGGVTGADLRVDEMDGGYQNDGMMVQDMGDGMDADDESMRSFVEEDIY
jgi:tetratricopeptide (TPR) repeat protein